MNNLSDVVEDDSLDNTSDLNRFEFCKIQENSAAIEVKEPAAKKAKYTSVVQDLDLEDAILDSPLGPSLNIIYQCENKFDSGCQSSLVRILSLYLLKNFGT